tara:strand:- start:862 stop:972 length:111 start_codon:yes stop_codon:yes gene_type:complete
MELAPLKFKKLGVSFVTQVYLKTPQFYPFGCGVFAF